jgi:hypothetical protein
MPRLLPAVTVLVLLVGTGLPGESDLAAVAAQPSRSNAPEVFTCQAQGRTEFAGAATNFEIHVDRYTAEHDRNTMTEARRRRNPARASRSRWCRLPSMRWAWAWGRWPPRHV